MGAMQGQGAGGAEADNGPADTRTPVGAVRAFLSALRVKDRDRLSEATAAHSGAETLLEIGADDKGQSGQRAPSGAASTRSVETTGRNRELFGKIVDGSISDAELDQIAKKLEGFQVAGENAVKSTGGAGVFVDKASDSDGYYRRVFTLRKEKKGWGVMDISPATEFKGMGSGVRRAKAASRK
jgi:hypothetical protein